MAEKIYTKDGKIIITGLLIEAGNRSNDAKSHPLDLKGIKWEHPEKTYISKDFKTDPDNVIGEINNFVVSDIGLKVDATFYKDILTGYPAIGGKILECDGKIISKFELTSVSICKNQNADHSIKPIHEQITSIKLEEFGITYIKK